MTHSTFIAKALVSCLALYLSGCATRYNLKSQKTSDISAHMVLPNGPPDRLVVRIDNPEDGWLHVRWDEARIVGITGFAVPAQLKPSNPLSSIPPHSSVEYHLFPDHSYSPAGYQWARRDGFDKLVLFDNDYDRLISNSQTPRLSVYLPVCMGQHLECDPQSDNTKDWVMGSLSSKVERVH
jgi:hypothetical protein